MKISYFQCAFLPFVQKCISKAKYLLVYKILQWEIDFFFPEEIKIEIRIKNSVIRK